MLRGSATPSEILSSVKDVFHPGQNIPERSGTTPFDPAIQHPQHHHHNYALAPDDGLFLQTPSPLTQSEAKLPDPLYVPAANQDVTMRPTSATRLGSPLAYEDNAMPGYRGRRASERPLSSPRMGTRPGSSRRDIMELTSVSLVGKQKSAEFDDGKEASEDVALAKWRKWVVEKPLPPNTSPGSSPNKSRKNSPASQLIPLAPLSATSSVSRPSPLPVPGSSRVGASSSDRSDESRHSRTAPSSSRFPAYEDDDFVIYNTESIRALRDVELAVDESVFANQISSQGRRMSTNPRLSNTENHFNDLATRLSSRRVRPLVLELIQALGHYVDAVWCTTHPDIPCPWSGRSAGQWTSTMITAVQQGKEQGYVSNPPTMADVHFWESEVKHTTRDVDDVVGIYKGEQWAFNTALTNGRYGDPDQANVLGNDGEGGNMARLLNDLEEALWGDAPPRPTDLAFELPADFDPYAVPEPSSGINTSRRSGSLSSAKPTAPAAASAEESSEPKLNTWNLDAFKIEGDGLTLEEIGRRRHQEWLKSKQ